MPKRLVGGVFLLCLTALTLTLSEDSETLTNITQPEILEQLTNLKKYIPNPSMIKPVWVQLKNGDEIVVVQGEMKVVDTGEFEIVVAINGYKLLIHIEFTQVLNEDDEPIDDWYIAENDAKYLFTSDYKRVFVEDVKNIDGNILSTLQCGDVVIKHDESGEHSYIVTFKSETGCCLTYADASVIETQSYDLVDDEWVYNSEDKTPNLLNVAEKSDIKEIYFHPMAVWGKNETSSFKGLSFSCVGLNNSNTAIDTPQKFIDWIEVNHIRTLSPVSGSAYKESVSKRIIISWIDVYYDGDAMTGFNVRGHFADDDNSNYLEELYISKANFLAYISITDSVNKIN